MCGYVCCVVFYFLILGTMISDTRAIEENDAVQDWQLAVKLANYRHRFEHSSNLRKVRWTLKHRYNKAYCQFCDLVVPVV